MSLMICQGRTIDLMHHIRTIGVELPCAGAKNLVIHRVNFNPI